MADIDLTTNTFSDDFKRRLARHLETAIRAYDAMLAIAEAHAASGPHGGPIDDLDVIRKARVDAQLVLLRLRQS